MFALERFDRDRHPLEIQELLIRDFGPTIPFVRCFVSLFSLFTRFYCWSFLLQCISEREKNPLPTVLFRHRIYDVWLKSLRKKQTIASARTITNFAWDDVRRKISKKGDRQRIGEHSVWWISHDLLNYRGANNMRIWLDCCTYWPFSIKTDWFQYLCSFFFGEFGNYGYLKQVITSTTYAILWDWIKIEKLYENELLNLSDKYYSTKYSMSCAVKDIRFKVNTVNIFVAWHKRFIFFHAVKIS